MLLSKETTKLRFLSAKITKRSYSQAITKCQLYWNLGKLLEIMKGSADALILYGMVYSGR